MRSDRQTRDVRFPTVSDRIAEFAGGPFGANNRHCVLGLNLGLGRQGFAKRGK
jgi:hypothetical protein